MTTSLQAQTMSAVEAAEQWSCTRDDVYDWCKDNVIEGAQKKGRSWTIPRDSMRPFDKKLAKEVLWQLLELKLGTANRFDLSSWGIKQAHLKQYLELLIDACYIQQDISAPSQGGRALPYRITNKGLNLLGRMGTTNAEYTVPPKLMVAATVAGRFASQLASDLLGISP